jgi:PAS domain S-box-containing protein
LRSKLSSALPLAIRGFAGMPIKSKLMVIIMTVTTAALGLSGLALMVADSVLYRGHMEHDLAALAQIIGDNSTAALSFEDPENAAETLTALRARTHVAAACIYRPDGRVFAQYLREGVNSSCPPAAPEGVRSTDREITVSHAIILANRTIGTCVLLYDLGEMYERRTLYGGIVLGILLVSSLVALLLSSRLRQVIATPISDLAHTTSAVAQTRDYSIRAPKVSRDELGVLVDAFNSMLIGIQSRDQELRQALVAREDALREAQTARDFLTTTLASIGDAVVATDAQGRVVFANPIACQLTGYAESVFTGRPLHEVLNLVNEQTRIPMENPVIRALREGKIVGTANHTVLISRDGRETPIDVSAAPIRNREGGVGGVVLIVRDITERRKAERELQAAREQLQLVTDTMAPAVSHCSRDLKYLWVSRRFAEWMRSTPADLAGRPICDVVGPVAFRALLPRIERVLARERLEYEAEIPYAEIGLRWIHAVYVPTYDAAGAVSGWVADVSDITELKRAEAEVARINADLQITNKRLARSNEDLAGFAFAASHDLQEPLRMINTYVQLLVRALPTQIEGEKKLFVQNIVDGVMRMRVLLADLLAYSELGSEPDEPSEPVDLNLVLASVLQNLKVSVEENGAEILSRQLPVVDGYASHFVQLFQNLVGNAIKYRSDSPPKICISWQREGGCLRFAVADNGIGIDPQYHAKIFRVFKRLHGKKIPGTGIGLAICQRVVEKYHGRIWVESQEGFGATFYLTLASDGTEGQGRNHE